MVRFFFCISFQAPDTATSIAPVSAGGVANAEGRTENLVYVRLIRKWIGDWWLILIRHSLAFGE